MNGPISQLLLAVHATLDAALARAVAGSTVDMDAYEILRAGLLRHIGIEEKVLLPAARERRGGEPLPVARQLRLDHAALAAMFVPTPSIAILTRMKALLHAHNPLEEGPGGLYELCDQLLAGDPAVLDRLRGYPSVPLAKHFDGDRAHSQIESLLQAAAEGRRR
jgi:hypothetical protein